MTLPPPDLVPPERLPLVVVPGLGLGPEVYAGLAAALPDHDLLVVPLPGYGRPAPRGAALGPPVLARQVLDEADRLGLLRFGLLGHSSGAQVVAEAAAQAPHRVAAVVLVGTTTDPRAAGWGRLAARWLATAVFERPGQVPVLVRVYARTGLGSMARAMDASRRHRVDRTASRVRRPVLVVRGRRDRIAPEDWADAVASAAGGRAVTLPVGAHMIPITHPGRLAAVVGPWLRAVTGPPAA